MCEQVTEQIIQADNLRSFFRFVNKRIYKRSSISFITSENDVILHDDCDKAEAFNKYLQVFGVLIMVLYLNVSHSMLLVWILFVLMKSI